MSLTGKGFMIWKIPSCESGNPANIASAAHAAGLSHVHIKIANGINPYNIDTTHAIDLVPPVVSALKGYGIQVWGWHYVYGDDPAGEARIAATRVKQLGLDGYVIDAESEYKQPDREDNAILFMSELRRELPQTPVALCSYRYPNLHRELPWAAFLDRCDYNMPQVYWEQAHNPGEQLRSSVKQFQALVPYRPIIPTGPVYRAGGWEPTAVDLVDFMDTAKTLNLNAVNYFAWDYGRSILQPLWNTVASYNWGSPPVYQDIPVQYINALNAHDANRVAALYRTEAVHITAAQTLQGTNAIRTWFSNLFTQTLPNASFTLTGVTGSGNSRHFTWTASSSGGQVRNGNDTIGILDGKITYHYSFFSITR
jgi:hypothetical protein